MMLPACSAYQPIIAQLAKLKLHFNLRFVAWAQVLTVGVCILHGCLQ